MRHRYAKQWTLVALGTHLVCRLCLRARSFRGMSDKAVNLTIKRIDALDIVFSQLKAAKLFVLQARNKLLGT